MNNTIPDIQSQQSHIALTIQQVGITELLLPIRYSDSLGTQHVEGMFKVFVTLPEDERGTHMSRFVEIATEASQDLHYNSIKQLVKKIRESLQSPKAEIYISFNYFTQKLAPVSKKHSMMDYKVAIHAIQQEKEQYYNLSVGIPVTSLCPCSKKISQYGAHNQRSLITISVQVSENFEIAKLIELAESQASCQLYGVLKREDEKYVTEYAYDHPKFVEDLVREIARTLKVMPSIQSGSVESENFESIHNHNAYAKIIW
ncbi:MAG: GTP cyclohydrolase FolE2 [Methylacidiphilales bacterium]|nr:GTP cyclohydrolase FolE2 [Candidatus Methylacidiphilales bacterium]